MAYTIEVSLKAKKQLDKLDPKSREQIIRYLQTIDRDNPWSQGKALHGRLREHWVYRSGDFRILSTFVRDRLVVLVVEIKNRRESYR